MMGGAPLHPLKPSALMLGQNSLTNPSYRLPATPFPAALLFGRTATSSGRGCWYSQNRALAREGVSLARTTYQSGGHPCDTRRKDRRPLRWRWRPEEQKQGAPASPRVWRDPQTEKSLLNGRGELQNAERTAEGSGALSGASLRGGRPLSDPAPAASKVLLIPFRFVSLI